VSQKFHFVGNGEWVPGCATSVRDQQAAIIALFRVIDASDNLVIFARSSDDAAFDSRAVLEATKVFGARTERLTDHAFDVTSRRRSSNEAVVEVEWRS
jgi:hypothetical protein